MSVREEAELLGCVPTQLFIGGRWTNAEDQSTFAVHDPSTGEVIRQIADATPPDATAALDAAVAAQPEWAATAPRVRSDILRRAFELVLQRREDLALIMTLEMGKPLGESRAEVTYAAEFLRWFSEEAVRISGRYSTNPAGSGRVLVSKHPVGPCYLITPWNFPLAMATRKVAPALAAGCTCVLKPAELTPLTTLLFTTLLEEAGLPPGVVNIITTTSSAAVSEPIIGDPRLRKLSFTGSTPVGRRLIAQSAERVLRVSMELGGNAPFLVFEDADLDAAVDGAMQAKFRNIGQACTAANRFLVHESVSEEFTRRIGERVRALTVGRGTQEGVDIGPLVDDEAVTSVTGLVEDAVRRGAIVAAAGTAPQTSGSFFAPIVLTDVPAGSALLTEEIFGPLLAITTFGSEDEAVGLANATEYGLVSYAYTRDLARAHRLIDRLQTGMMGLNVGVVSDAAAPFGGVKQSGLGREGGLEGLDEYLSTKYTLIPADRAGGEGSTR